MLNELSIDEWCLIKSCIGTVISEAYSKELVAELESLKKKVQAIVNKTDRKALFTIQHPLEMEGVWHIFIYIFDGGNNIEVFWGTHNGTWKIVSDIAWEANRSYKNPRVQFIKM
jgi:hypothetical protein